MPGFVSLDYGHGTLLHSTSAINCVKGVLGGGTAGTARDTLLLKVYIALNATAVTVTIAGLAGEDGTARNWVLTGQTGADSTFSFEYPVLNEATAFTFTPSVADKVTVVTRPYTGP